MPINPNIALGGQPVQQPNILGQMGQMMAIRAASQEIEGSEGVRNALREGMPDDPTTLLQYGKQGRATYESLLKGRKEKVETALKQIEMSSSAFKVIEQDPTLETAQTVFDNLVNMGGMDKNAAAGALAKVMANPTPDNIRKLAKQGIQYGITAAQDLVAQTSRRGQDITAGTTIRGQNMTDARMRDQMEFDRQKGKIIPGEGQFYREDVYGNIYPVKDFGAQFGPNAPAQPLPQAAANAFVTSAQPSINALAPTAPPVVQPGLPTRANAAAIEAQQNIPRPKVPFTTPVPVIDKSGNTVLMQGREAVATGATPATPATEARQIAIRKLPDAIAQSKDALNLIDKMVGKADGSTKPAPGFKGAVGAGIGLRFIPGTSEADFQAMYDQIQGGAFLQAFNTLKGGGQITEKEGEKGTAAINRMKLATSEKAFIDASRDFQNVLQRGIETAQKELGSGNKGSATNDPLGLR